MRVIGGTAKGRRLHAVPGSTTRPITDRVKEALFNILGVDVVDARFLDLFAGTGSVGIEALSRGAAHVDFVERAGKAVATIHRNLRETGLAERATVIRRDVFAFLETAEGPYDIVFLAPPQYRGLWIETLRALDRRPELLAPEGQIVVQIDPLEYEALPLTHFALVDQRVYGSTMLCFYVPKVANSSSQNFKENKQKNRAIR